MKKVLITSVCALAMAGSAFAQGKINWSTISASAFTAQTNATSYSPLFGGGSAGGATGSTAAVAGLYNYALLFNGTSVPVSGAGVAAPTTLAGLSGWTESGLTAANSASAGRAAPNNPTTSATMPVPWASGVTQNVMIVGWSANLGATWATALATLNSAVALGNVVGNAFFGMSSTGYIAAGGADPGVFAIGTSDVGFGLPVKSLLTQLYLVPVTPVPEPATIALAGLGGLALLALRRKK